jgi:hypothetical protein
MNNVAPGRAKVTDYGCSMCVGRLNLCRCVPIDLLMACGQVERVRLLCFQLPSKIVHNLASWGPST